MGATLRRLRFPTLFGLLFLTLFSLSEQLVPVLDDDYTIAVAQEPVADATLPYSLRSGGREMITLRGTLHHSYFSSGVIKIIPDDCLVSLRVNDTDVDVSKLPGRCDWSKGATIDLSEQLTPGVNALRITVHKRDGAGGVNLFGVAGKSGFFTLLFKVLSAMLLAAVILSLTRERLGWPAALLLAASALLQLHYLGYTDFATRTFDLLIATGHLDYIKMIAHELTLPNPTQGWEYHQPPLYYLPASALYALCEQTGVMDPMRALQLFSLLCFVVFGYFGLRILQLTVADRRVMLLGGALLLFWPSGVIHAIRIGNDVLFFTLFAATLFATVRWQLQGARLWPALLLASLTLITKANGIVLFAILGMLVLVEVVQTRHYKAFLRHAGLGLLFFAGAFLINFADNIYYVMIGEAKDWLLSNVTINGGLFVKSSAYNYLYFDWQTYLKEPFTNGWNDQYGRQFFWNYMLKSSLFSEFFFDAKRNLAILIGAVSLPLFGLMLLGMAVAPITRASLIMGLTLTFAFAAVIVYHIKIPAACHADFRFVYPALIALIYFYAEAVSWLRRKAPVQTAVAAGALSPLFVLLVVRFYL